MEPKGGVMCLDNGGRDQEMQVASKQEKARKQAP